MAIAHASPEVDGARLRQLRKLAGLSVADLAAKIGCTAGYVSHIERGTRRTCSAAMFGRICDAMGITDRTELMRDDNPEAA